MRIRGGRSGPACEPFALRRACAPAPGHRRAPFACPPLWTHPQELVVHTDHAADHALSREPLLDHAPRQAPHVSSAFGIAEEAQDARGCGPVIPAGDNVSADSVFEDLRSASDAGGYTST